MFISVAVSSRKSAGDKTGLGSGDCSCPVTVSLFHLSALWGQFSVCKLRTKGPPVELCMHTAKWSWAVPPGDVVSVLETPGIPSSMKVHLQKTSFQKYTFDVENRECNLNIY